MTRRRTRPTRRPGIRRVALGLWLALFAAANLVLGAEIVLRLQARAAGHRMAELAARNVFIQGADNALDRALWAKRWQRYRPHARLDSTTKDGGRFVITINSHGFRTPEFTIPKPPGTLRIACLGASTTVQGRRDELTYPAQLERALRRRFPELEIEVLNLGISGTRSDHWLSRLERLDAIDPDVVLQYNGANDIVQTYFAGFAVEHPLRATLYGRSRLVNRVLPPSAAHFEAGFVATLDHIAALHRHVEKQGGLYIGATFAAPDAAAADPEMREYLDYVTELWSAGRVLGYRPYRTLLDELNERLRRQADSAGYPLVDVAASLRHPELFTDLCHMHPRGIAGLAAAFLPAVSRAVELRRQRLTAPT